MPSSSPRREPSPPPEEPARRVVPKFASFKPAVPPPAVAAPAPAGPAKEASADDKKPRDKERNRRHGRASRSRSRDRKHRRERDREREGDGSSGRRHRHRSRSRDHGHDQGRRSHHHHRRKHDAPSVPSAAVAAAPKRVRSRSPEWDAPQKQYWVDTKGDPDIRVYGTIHRYAIPDYYRSGAGSIVGLPPAVKIDRDKGDGRALVLRVPGDESRGGGGRTGKGMLAKLGDESKAQRRLRIKKNEAAGLEEAFTRGLDFVALDTRSRKRKGRAYEEQEGGADWMEHYLSLEGPRRETGPRDEDLEYASDSESNEDYIESDEWGNREQRIALVRKVDAEPKNVEAWLEYVDYQDKALQSHGRRTTAAERRSTAEIRMDILTKALDKNPGNERLLLRYMAVAETIWDPQKLLSRWKQVLDETPSASGLWTAYINFRQTDFLSFTYPACMECYNDCLSGLRSAALKALAGSEDRRRLEDIIVYIFLRAVLLMRDAGYKENAIAAFQAMLELNLCRPAQMALPSMHQDLDTLLQSFEKFWDSEVLRIGETGARGWAAFVAEGRTGDAPEAATQKLDLMPLDEEDLFGSWAGAETEWERSIVMPARTTDEVEEDDPYRVVLFSDVKPLLFCFSSDASRKRLVDAFLVFNRLPPSYSLHPTCSNSEESFDPFLRDDLAVLTDEVLASWFWPKTDDQRSKAITWEGMEPESAPGIDDNAFAFRPKNFPVGPETMFSTPNWFHRMDSMGTMRAGSLSLVEEALKLLISSAGADGEDLAIYHLALVWENRREGIKKTAKALLKRFKMSMRLWSAYAQVEWYLGNQDTARTIFSTALSMVDGLPELVRRDTIVLWNTWVWAELSAGHYDTALRLALSIDSGKPLDDAQAIAPGAVPGALLLKAQRHLQEQQDHMFSTQSVAHAGLYNDTLALLLYLAANRSLPAALPPLDAFAATLAARGLAGAASAAHESHLLRRARLLHHHARTARPFQPALLRGALEAALQLFPHNTAFLALYAQNEARARIEGRVRRLVRDRVLAAGRESVLGWCFALWTELRLPPRPSSHAVRALFERAAAAPRTSAAAAVWRVWVLFELRECEPRRAKDVLMRAVRCCPWNKDLMMLAFTRLRAAFDPDELRKLLGIMSAEKELRTHDVTELEDAWEARSRALGVGSAAAMELRLPEDPESDREMGEGY